MESGYLIALAVFVGLMAVRHVLEKIVTALNASREVADKAVGELARVGSKLDGLWASETEKSERHEAMLVTEGVHERLVEIVKARENSKSVQTSK